jgi:hypothetical protein
MVQLRTGVTGAATAFVRAAIMSEAQLMAGVAGVVTCTRDDIDYVGGPAHADRNARMKAKTGFLKLPLSGPTVELHVHWEQAGTMELTSMHVQINRANGPELDDLMNFFPLLMAATVNALNAHGLTDGGTVLAPVRR